VKAIRFPDGLVVVLALTAGSVDAVSSLRLGNVLSSDTTVNLVLLGLSEKQEVVQAGEPVQRVEGGIQRAFPRRSRRG
jgi:uncharacterized membrane protein YoaK (UPF0700 family)